MTEGRQAEQARRLVFIYRELMNGKQFTTAELREIFREMYDSDITLRTIQRDIKLLKECVPE